MGESHRLISEAADHKSHKKNSQKTRIGFYVILLISAGVIYSGVPVLLIPALILIVGYIVSQSLEDSLLMFCVAAPLDRLLVMPNGMHIVAYLIPLIFIKMMYEVVFVRERISKEATAIFTTLVVFMTYEFMHFIAYEIPSLTRNILFLLGIAVVVLQSIIRPDVDMHRVAKWMGISAVFGSFISLRAVGGLTTLVALSGGSARFAIEGEDVNTYGVYLLVIAAANFAVFINREKGRFIYLVNVIMLILFGLLTLSRGFVLNLAILIFLAFLLVFKWHFRNVVRLMIGLAVVTAVALLLYQVPVVNGLVTNYTNRFRVSDLSNGRFELFRYYLNYMAQNVEVLVFGLGIDNYRAVTGISYAVHNTYIEVLLSEGLVGTLLLGVLIFLIFNRIRIRLSDSSILYLLPLGALLVGSITLSLFSITSFYFFLLFAMISAEYIGKRLSDVQMTRIGMTDYGELQSH